MSDGLSTFASIFHAPRPEDPKKVDKVYVEIPKIQRDYAQGRAGDPGILRIRERFLDTLHDALVDPDPANPTQLDFIYGDIHETGGRKVLTLLDGQQRITTLFLLHWYAAMKEGIPMEEREFLRRFTYETRFSARDFCAFLCGCDPSASPRDPLSERIKDQPQFMSEWAKDPTIAAMLVMLDAIDDRFSDVSGLWENLLRGAVGFYFTSVENMGQTDKIYITMNSRGKPLTLFEHLKAEIEKEMAKADPETARRVAAKMDSQWTDLLWPYRDRQAQTIDDQFTRYLRFIADIICYTSFPAAIPPTREEWEAIGPVAALFSLSQHPAEKARENALLLESCFDCWCRLQERERVPDFFDRFVTRSHDPAHSVRIVSPDDNKDFLRKVLRGEGKLRETILLYAFVTYLLHANDTGSELPEGEFATRLRVVNNLVRSSELHDLHARMMSNALLQTRAIVLRGRVDSWSNSFTMHQLNEEREKLDWLRKADSDAIDQLYALEDHRLLNGQIGIVGLKENASSEERTVGLTERVPFFSDFMHLFSEERDWDLVDTAMMSEGFYPQQAKARRDAFQFGTSKKDPGEHSWYVLFHKTSRRGYENTQNILWKLLDEIHGLEGSALDERLREITERFTESCERDSLYPWRYYYVRYRCFRPGAYGKYRATTTGISPDQWESDYLFTAMLTSRNLTERKAYIPFLKMAQEVLRAEDNGIADEHVELQRRGTRLRVRDHYIGCEQDAFVLCDMDGCERDRLPIAQTRQGTDTENRMEKLLAKLPEWAEKTAPPSLS